MKKKNLGFSLIEVTLAVGIIAFAFLQIISLMPAGLARLHSAKELTVATQIATHVTNELKQTDFTQLRQSPTVFFRYYDTSGANFPVDELGNTAPTRTDVLYVTKIELTPESAQNKTFTTITTASLIKAKIVVAYNPQCLAANNLFNPPPGKPLPTIAYTTFLYLGYNN